jgi:hypothetical protein
MLFTQAERIRVFIRTRIRVGYRQEALCSEDRFSLKVQSFLTKPGSRPDILCLRLAESDKSNTQLLLYA